VGEKGRVLFDLEEGKKRKILPLFAFPCSNTESEREGGKGSTFVVALKEEKKRGRDKHMTSKGGKGWTLETILLLPSRRKGGRRGSNLGNCNGGRGENPFPIFSGKREKKGRKLNPNCKKER